MSTLDFFVTGLIGHSRLVYSNYLSQFCFYISHLVDWLILALPCQINQISDSSQPNNCIIAASLFQMPVNFHVFAPCKTGDGINKLLPTKPFAICYMKYRFAEMHLHNSLSILSLTLILLTDKFSSFFL